MSKYEVTTPMVSYRHIGTTYGNNGFTIRQQNRRLTLIEYLDENNNQTFIIETVVCSNKKLNNTAKRAIKKNGGRVFRDRLIVRVDIYTPTTLIKLSNAIQEYFKK